MSANLNGLLLIAASQPRIIFRIYKGIFENMLHYRFQYTLLGLTLQIEFHVYLMSSFKSMLFSISRVLIPG